MLRIQIKSNFFSCDVRMDDNKKVEQFLIGIRNAFRAYKNFGNQALWMISEHNLLRLIDTDENCPIKPDSIPGERRREKIQDDVLSVKISKCEW